MCRKAKAASASRHGSAIPSALVERFAQMSGSWRLRLFDEQVERAQDRAAILRLGEGAQYRAETQGRILQKEWLRSFGYHAAGLSKGPTSGPLR
jgi:hypothetical protein